VVPHSRKSFNYAPLIEKVASLHWYDLGNAGHCFAWQYESPFFLGRQNSTRFFCTSIPSILTWIRLFFVLLNVRVRKDRWLRGWQVFRGRRRWITNHPFFSCKSYRRSSIVSFHNRLSNSLWWNTAPVIPSVPVRRERSSGYEQENLWREGLERCTKKKRLTIVNVTLQLERPPLAEYSH